MRRISQHNRARLAALVVAVVVVAALAGCTPEGGVANADGCERWCGNSGGGEPASRSNGRAGQWSSEQQNNARLIADVGRGRGISRRGQVIAVATAMQESHLRNLPGGDRDSVGLFQQRPSQGWGSWSQVHDPRYAAGKFYDHLVRVRGWESMPVSAAAQRVQRSAYPGAYAKWQGDAERLVG